MANSLNKRQEQILTFLGAATVSVAVSEIFTYLQDKNLVAVSRMTVNRDLRGLKARNYIEQLGSGRGATYFQTPEYKAARPINVEEYFAVDPDKRKIQKSFNFDIFSLLGRIFTPTELGVLEKLNVNYLQKLRKLSPAALKKEYERLVIELSWKSSKIEGNTYSLLETEFLLRERIEPKGHTREETTMILNHKIALDYIRKHASRFKKLDLRDIENVHGLLINGLNVKKNIRQGLVRISGTAYRPLDNKFQIREAVEKMCALVNKQKNPFTKSMIAMIMISYIQPFEDGNKRASRLIGDALLLAYAACPLSFRSIDELEYKKAILLFYEQNNFKYFKDLFIGQFKFTVENYFG